MSDGKLFLKAFSCCALMVVSISHGVFGGELEAPAPPGSTMRTLQEIYDKLEVVELKVDTVDSKISVEFIYTNAAAGVQKSGQTTSYRAGDDGAHQSGVTWPVPRFTDNGDGTVVDNLTGLTWSKNANNDGAKLWNDAIDYCNMLELAGFNDWRLPNRREMLSLVDDGRHDLALPNGHPFENVAASGYWSCTTFAGNQSQAFEISMVSGLAVPQDKGISRYVWPVRSDCIGVNHGLMLHYTFDNDGPDGLVVDCSGMGFHGQVAGGVDYVAQAEGYAIKTSSRDTYVICEAEELDLDGWSQFSVSLRFKLHQYSTYGRIISKGISNSDINARRMDHGVFCFRVGGIYGSEVQEAAFLLNLQAEEDNLVQLVFPRFAELNQWYHIVGVYDGTSLRYYVNGEQAASIEVPEHLVNKPVLDEHNGDVLIGKCAIRRDWFDTHINGLIDDVRIYNRALSLEEIQNL